MAKAVADPEELRRFAQSLKAFNANMGQAMQQLQGNAIALGQTWREATRKFQREAVLTGMVSMLNFLKTVGIVALPGAMTGMILAGADPLEAVLLQLIVGYMLISSVTITSVATMELAIRQFFTTAHQYRD